MDYAHNIFLFADADRLREDSELRHKYEKTNLQQLGLVHPRRYLQPFQCGVSGALRLLAQASVNAARRRIQRLPPRKRH